MKAESRNWNTRLAASMGTLLGRDRNGTAPEQTFRAAPFTDLAMYKSMRRYETIGGVIGLKTPFFRTIEGTVIAAF